MGTRYEYLTNQNKDVALDMTLLQTKPNQCCNARYDLVTYQSNVVMLDMTLLQIKTRS